MADDPSDPNYADTQDVVMTDGITTSPISSLPTELIEKILENLDAQSIFNVRLTCNDLAQRSVGPHLLKTCYRLQNTSLSFTDLARVEAVLSDPVFGAAVNHLTVRATVYHIDPQDRIHMSRAAAGTTNVHEQLARFHENLDWIADRRGEQEFAEWNEHEDSISQLAGIMKRLGGPDAEQPTLSSGLDLVGVISPGPGLMYNPARSGPVIWNNMARRASQTFYVTIKAMVQSGLKTPLLWIYPQTRRCSVPAGTISHIMSSINNEDLAAALSGIKNFALSFAPMVGTKADLGLHVKPGKLSENLRDIDEEEGWDWRLPLPRPRQELGRLLLETIYAVPKFLSLISTDVEILDLHMFNPYQRRSADYSCIFTILAQEVLFTKLKDCTLRGIWAKEHSLLNFFHNHANQLERLQLRDIWLVEGNWAKFFRWLNPEVFPNLKYLRLENLFHGDSHLVNIAPPDTALRRKGLDTDNRPTEFEVAFSPNSHFNCMGGKCVFLREWDREMFWLESRDEEGVPVGMKFTELPRGSPLPSPEFKSWKLMRGDEFGPPPEAREWEEHYLTMGRSATMDNRGEVYVGIPEYRR
ncbi:hypothetical protein V8F20_004333 [Naviculisporaceae sp. PSN 640]